MSGTDHCSTNEGFVTGKGAFARDLCSSSCLITVEAPLEISFS